MGHVFHVDKIVKYVRVLLHAQIAWSNNQKLDKSPIYINFILYKFILNIVGIS